MTNKLIPILQFLWIDIKITELIEKFKKADNKLILLDYDGTLVNYEPDTGTSNTL